MEFVFDLIFGWMPSWLIWTLGLGVLYSIFDSIVRGIVREEIEALREEMDQKIHDLKWERKDDLVEYDQYIKNHICGIFDKKSDLSELHGKTSD